MYKTYIYLAICQNIVVYIFKYNTKVFLLMVLEFLLKLNSSSMAGSSGTDTSNLFMMALSANSIASVFIWLAVNSSSMAQSLSLESISGHIGAWSEVREIMSGEEGKSGAVCMEEVVASEALSSIP